MQRVGVECDECDADIRSACASVVNIHRATYLTVNSSRQNRALMKGVDRGPKALRPMSAYDLNFGSSRITWARILALCVQVICEGIFVLEARKRTYSR